MNFWVELFQRKLFKDSSGQMLQGIIGAICSFLLISVLFKHFGSNDFGVLVVVQSVCGVFSALLCLQFSKVMLSYAPGAENRDSLVNDNMRRGVLNEFSVALLAVFVVLLLSWFSARAVSCFGVLGTASICIGVVLLPCQSFGAAYRISGSYIQYLAVVTITSFCRLLIAVIVSVQNPDLLSSGAELFLIFVVPEIARYGYLYAKVPVSVSQHRFSGWRIDRNVILVSAQNWVDIPVVYLDKVVLSFVALPSDVGVYNILRRVGMLNSMLFSPVQGSLTHEYSGRINRGDGNSAGALMKKLLPYFSAVSIVMAVALFFSKNIWAPILFKGAIIPASLLAIILVSYAVQGAFTPMHPLLNAAKLFKESVKATAIANSIFLIAIVVGAIFLGVYGVAAALLLQFSVDAFMKITYLHSKRIV